MVGCCACDVTGAHPGHVVSLLLLAWLDDHQRSYQRSVGQ